MARTLDNGVLRVTTLEEAGGKIASIVLLATGREFLLQRDDSATPRTDGTYGAFESWGFDDCFPTVAPCIYPAPPFEGLALADHGYVWSNGAPKLPFAFGKHVKLEDDSVVIEYVLTNTGSARVYYSYTAHPLLAVEDGCIVRIPGEDAIEDRYSPSLEPRADMIFARSPREGTVSVTWPAGEVLELKFDPSQLPYVGYWNTRGGWPEDGTNPQYTIALEPCTSPNSLAQAYEEGLASSLEPGESTSWWLRLVARGKM